MNQILNPAQFQTLHDTLQEAINQLHSGISHHAIIKTVRFAKDLLSQAAPATAEASNTPAAPFLPNAKVQHTEELLQMILWKVLAFYDVSHEDFYGDLRTKKATEARYIFWWLAQELTLVDDVTLGAFSKKARNTVYGGVVRVKDIMAVEPHTKRNLMKMREDMRALVQAKSVSSSHDR